ncbi:hypothetical protein Q5P01_002106 [Channa striata]|uniref:Uncharacterized protein n=1 Tax=Channa striata TaxID=64152 RepID=A0AA88NSM9_CHASR|nr:hypothetical protein Q5P01_002106 [Channa striata]
MYAAFSADHGSLQRASPGLSSLRLKSNHMGVFHSVRPLLPAQTATHHDQIHMSRKAQTSADKKPPRLREKEIEQLDAELWQCVRQKAKPAMFPLKPRNSMMFTVFTVEPALVSRKHWGRQTV